MVKREDFISKHRRMAQKENELFLRGMRYIAGIDEAGRGPLAGPLVVASCVLDPQKPIYELDDSKKLSSNKRCILYEKITTYCVSYAICVIEPRRIDEINILEATKEAMRQCADMLDVRPDYLLIDAVRPDPIGFPYEAIIRGDSQSNAIAAASILAKVYRDQLMCSFESDYPGYGFAQHKGYGTKAHYQAIDRLGLCPIHRKSFVKKYLA